jgi:hypothetical protein
MSTENLKKLVDLTMAHSPHASDLRIAEAAQKELESLERELQETRVARDEAVRRVLELRGILPEGKP